MIKTADSYTEELILNHFLFAFASLISSYPGQGFGEETARFCDNEELTNSAAKYSNWQSVSEFFPGIIKNEAAVDDIRSDYISIFDGSMTGNSLYETEYGRNRMLAKANELADLAGFYKAFGLEPDASDTVPEMPDHISVELEFYSYLLMKEAFIISRGDETGQEIIKEARKKFLNDHLGRFAGSIALRPGVKANGFYSAVFGWISSLVDAECKKLGIEPERTEWISGQSEKEEMNCATTGDCSLKDKLNIK